jgi:hypothetical protein
MVLVPFLPLGILYSKSAADPPRGASRIGHRLCCLADADGERRMSAWLARLGALALATLVVADVARDLRETWTGSPYAAHGPLVGLFAAYARGGCVRHCPIECWRPCLPAALVGLATVAALAAGHAMGSLSLRAWRCR